ncbi:MAG TPA: YjgN family protein [Nitrospirales bacterium]
MRSATIDQPVLIHRFVFHGKGKDLFDIFIVNLLRTIATLGIYSFWAKTATRKYLWGQSEFAGDRFGYHGTGKELLLGWLKAIILFGGLIALQSLIRFVDHPSAKILSEALFYIGLAFLVPLAQTGSMRYRLSRTSWRGIRFTFRGDYTPFLWLSLRGYLLTALTLGGYYPYYHCNVRRFMTEHSYFGSTPFMFNGKGKDISGIYGSIVGVALLVSFLAAGAAIWLGLFTLLLLLPALGIIQVWFSTKMRRYYWNQTSFENCVFECTITTKELLMLHASNLFYLIITLGMALPWVKVRTMKYHLEHLRIQGALNLEGITQQAMTAKDAGDQLGDLLNVDGVFG